MNTETSNARGDVRGLELSDVITKIRFECRCGGTNACIYCEWAARIESALAAEGAQAGEVSVEVKIRARELLAQAFEAKAQHVQAAFVRKGCGGTAPEKVAIAAIASALSQQPEARGGVDELIGKLPTKMLHSQSWSFSYVNGWNDAINLTRQKLAAALTGERNE